MVGSFEFRVLVFSGLGAFVFAWLMPNHNPPWTSAYQEFSAFFAGLMLLGAAFLLFRKVLITTAIFGFLVLACVPLLQLWWGLIFFSSDAWVASVFVSGFSLMVMVGLNFSLRSDVRYFFVMLLAQAFVVAAVLSVWVAMRQWLLFPSGSFWVIDMSPHGRPFANLAQPNSLATLLCMGISGVIYFFETYRLGRFAAGMLAAFLIFGVALTQSRTPWVASIALIVFWGWKAYVTKLRLSVPAILGWVCFYALCLLALPAISEALFLAGGDLLVRALSFERLNMWGQLWYAVLQGPLWGYGWGQVSVAQVGVSVEYAAPGLMTLYSHNILLDLLLWNGPILGGVIVVSVAIWFLRIGYRVRSLEGLFALIAAGFILVHALLEYPLAYAFFLLPLGLLMGVAAADLRPIKGFEVSRWALSVCGLLAFFLFVWFWREYRIIDDYYRISRFEEARIGKLIAGPVPDVILLSEPREYIRFVRASVVEGMSTAQLEWMRKVALRRPGAFSLFRYALALGVNGQSAEACEQLKILHAQYGEKVYLQALEEFQRNEKKYPQLIEVGKHD